MPPKKNDEELQALKKAVAQLKKDISAELGDVEAEVQPLRRVAQDMNVPKMATNLKRRRILKGHFGKIYACQWSDMDSKHLVSAAQDGKLIVWNAMTTNKELAINLPSGYVMTCAYSPDGRMVACGGLDNLCTVFKIPAETGTVMESNRSHAVLQQHEGYLSCCRFIDNTQMLTASGDSTCMLWDIETKVPKMTFGDHTGDVMTLSVAPTGANWFVSGSCDSTAKMWDFRQEKCIQTFSGHSADINAIDCSPDSSTFITGSDDHSCRLFDTKACRQLNKYVDQACPVTSVSFSRSGKMFFAGYDNFSCHGWDTQWASVSDQLNPPHENRVSCVGVNKAGNALATGSWDTLLQVWA